MNPFKFLIGDENVQQPLAYRMRPTSIEEVVGQQHLVGEGKIINRMVKAKMLSSMILYGPPGTGKTSIASAIAGSTKYAFRKLNAATDSKKRSANRRRRGQDERYRHPTTG